MFGSPELHTQVSVFLYREARLLEDNRLDEWLECLTDDISYSMPVRESVEGQRGTVNPESVFALYEDDKQSLTVRVLRIKTGTAHAEVPLSITQRHITNIYVASAPAGNEIEVNSNFAVFQERRGRHTATFHGRRADLLRRTGSGFKIARRKIELAHSILPATLSLFL